jgi:hypothetical protein
MKKLSAIFNTRILIEFLSVAFAVFFALIVNQWKENRNNNKLAQISLNNIRHEISSNKGTLEDVMTLHENVLNLLDSLSKVSEDDSKPNNLDLNVNFQLLSNAAWDAAKLTQAIVYINIETVMDISMLYKLQDYYHTFVKDYITKNMDTSDIDFKNDADEIKQAHKFFEMIYNLEKNLMDTYDYALNDLLKEE